MTRDSYSHPQNPKSDSHLPHTADGLADTLLWATGLSKAAADNLRERLDRLDTRHTELSERLNDKSLSPDDRANIESSLELIQTVQANLAPQGETLDKLVRLHSDYAKQVASCDDAGKNSIGTTPSIIPGDSSHTIIRKSMMLAAATRNTLGGKVVKLQHTGVSAKPGATTL